MAIVIEPTDAELQVKVAQVLPWTGAQEQALYARVEHGRVSIAGNAPTAQIAADLRSRIRTVPGVREVISRVVDDDELQRRIQAMIEREPDAQAVRCVHVVLGKVFVDWEHREEACERRLRDLLLAVPGARAVIHGSWSKQREASAALSRGPLMSLARQR